MAGETLKYVAKDDVDCKCEHILWGNKKRASLVAQQ